MISFLIVSLISCTSISFRPLTQSLNQDQPETTPEFDESEIPKPFGQERFANGTFLSSFGGGLYSVFRGIGKNTLTFTESIHGYGSLTEALVDILETMNEMPFGPGGDPELPPEYPPYEEMTSNRNQEIMALSEDNPQAISALIKKAITSNQAFDVKPILNIGIGLIASVAIGWVLIFAFWLIMLLYGITWCCGQCFQCCAKCCNCCCKCCRTRKPCLTCGCWSVKKGSKPCCKICTRITFLVLGILLIAGYVCGAVAGISLATFMPKVINRLNLVQTYALALLSETPDAAKELPDSLKVVIDNTLGPIASEISGAVSTDLNNIKGAFETFQGGMKTIVNNIEKLGNIPGGTAYSKIFEPSLQTSNADSLWSQISSSNFKFEFLPDGSTLTGITADSSPGDLASVKDKLTTIFTTMKNDFDSPQQYGGYTNDINTQISTLTTAFSHVESLASNLDTAVEKYVNMDPSIGYKINAEFPRNPGQLQYLIGLNGIALNDQDLDFYLNGTPYNLKTAFENEDLRKVTLDMVQFLDLLCQYHEANAGTQPTLLDDIKNNEYFKLLQTSHDGSQSMNLPDLIEPQYSAGLSDLHEAQKQLNNTLPWDTIDLLKAKFEGSALVVIDEVVGEQLSDILPKGKHFSDLFDETIRTEVITGIIGTQVPIGSLTSKVDEMVSQYLSDEKIKGYSESINSFISTISGYIQGNKQKPAESNQSTTSFQADTIVQLVGWLLAGFFLLLVLLILLDVFSAFCCARSCCLGCANFREFLFWGVFGLVIIILGLIGCLFREIQVALYSVSDTPPASLADSKNIFDLLEDDDVMKMALNMLDAVMSGMGGSEEPEESNQEAEGGLKISALLTPQQFRDVLKYLLLGVEPSKTSEHNEEEEHMLMRVLIDSFKNIDNLLAMFGVTGVQVEPGLITKLSDQLETGFGPENKFHKLLHKYVTHEKLGGVLYSVLDLLLIDLTDILLALFSMAFICLIFAIPYIIFSSIGRTHWPEYSKSDRKKDEEILNGDSDDDDSDGSDSSDDSSSSSSSSDDSSDKSSASSSDGNDKGEEYY
ncbi:hypothetical protein BLNAU_13648 [Blattamonas nauphoetae]|uniref:Uncharacterized protein n=1 Tax=Blattamonas nauphoetae TaxID=2049346 RepID=A0ABQ9XFW9_9EUKA|nr:hypothetical protein BLNAU_13648 [Blattamonas nauphoetae]